MIAFGVSGHLRSYLTCAVAYRFPDLPVVWMLDGSEQAMVDAAVREGVELPS
jgi:hypothetical protein